MYLPGFGWSQEIDGIAKVDLLVSLVSDEEIIVRMTKVGSKVRSMAPNTFELWLQKMKQYCARLEINW